MNNFAVDDEGILFDLKPNVLLPVATNINKYLSNILTDNIFNSHMVDEIFMEVYLQQFLS
jgi:hypothetical protein